MTTRKREGDGGTPIAVMPMVDAYLRRDRKVSAQAIALPFRTTRPNDGWCDAPAAPNYNRPVRLPQPYSAERMAREDVIYDIVIVLDYNFGSRSRHRGSAIFLHVARPGFEPTEGCIAVRKRDLQRILPHLLLGRRIIVQ